MVSELFRAWLDRATCEHSWLNCIMVSILFLPEEAPWNYRYSTGFSHSSLDGIFYLLPRRDSRVVP